MTDLSKPIVVYVTDWCPQVYPVRRLLEENKIPAIFVDIEEDHDAREELLEINHGYASVPTLRFPDGSKLIEPSLGELREKLGLGNPGLVDKARRWLEGDR
jgi:mycoredoxin